MASRTGAISRATAYLESGQFEADLVRRVAIPTQSQTPEGLPYLTRYLDEEKIPSFEAIGFSCQKFEYLVAGAGPILLASRIEDPSLPTVLGYGHGDVICVLDNQQTKGAGPWQTQRDGDRLYGRETADNKGQHTINMASMNAVIEERGKLGFNSKVMIEIGEENGSAGVHQIMSANTDAFAADVFISSDGPRVRMVRPTMSLGARGAQNFDLICDLREGGHHSGKQGGALADPATILAHAVSTIVIRISEIRIKEWRPLLSLMSSNLSSPMSSWTAAPRVRRLIQIGESRGRQQPRTSMLGILLPSSL